MKKILTVVICLVAVYAVYDNISEWFSGDDDSSLESYLPSESSSTNNIQSEIVETRRIPELEPFRSETNVRNFLQCHKFKSDAGDVLEFESFGNQMNLNGTPMTSAIEVVRIEPKAAVIKSVGPYGTGTFVVINEEWGGAVRDANDGTSWSFNY